MIVVGLDVSLNSTGAARVDTHTGRTRLLTIKSGGRRTHERIENTLREIVDFTRDADLVGIEGLAGFIKSTVLDEIHGMHWHVRHQIWRRGIPYAITPPVNVKGYTTGSTTASKLDMVRALRQAFPGMDLSEKRDDEADALAIAAMVCRFNSQTIDAHVQRWPHFLEHCHWPDQDREPRIIRTKKTPRSPLAR